MPLPSVDQRVSYLEGRTEEHSGMIAGVRADIRDVRAEMAALRADMGALRAEMREFRTEMVRRFEHVDTRFNWMLGLMFAIVLALVSAVLTLRYS